MVGFRLRRQEGSHRVLRRDQPFAQVVVPDHKELDGGTLSWGEDPNPEHQRSYLKGLPLVRFGQASLRICCIEDTAG